MASKKSRTIRRGDATMVEKKVAEYKRFQHTTSSFGRPPGILGSGAILSRFGYNVANTEGGGFNNKNRHDRTSPLDQDCVRKFFRDSDYKRQCAWYNRDPPSYFRTHRAFDKQGVFMPDQTHLVVPENPNYVDIDGAFITNLKKEYAIDVLVPLKLSMDVFTDAVRVAESEYLGLGRWEAYQNYEWHGERIVEEVCVIENPGIWDECDVPLHVSLMRIRITGAGGREEVKHWGLATTYKPRSATEAFETYSKRTCIEERHKQFKRTWNITKFSSPDRSLVETHVLFTLLTYSLVQLYLSKKHLSELADKTIDSLRNEERLGKDNVVVYGKQHFAVFDLDEYTDIIAHLNPDARDRFCTWLERFRRNGKMRTE